MILIASLVLPIAAEIIGIIINLKYPKMDAENDTEVVKQSMSSTVAVLVGIVFIALTGYGLYKLVSINIPIDLVILAFLGLYTLLCIALLVYLRTRGVKKFNEINV